MRIGVGELPIYTTERASHGSYRVWRFIRRKDFETWSTAATVGHSASFTVLRPPRPAPMC